MDESFVHEVFPGDDYRLDVYKRKICTNFPLSLIPEGMCAVRVYVPLVRADTGEPITTGNVEAEAIREDQASIIKVSDSFSFLDSVDCPRLAGKSKREFVVRALEVAKAQGVKYVYSIIEDGEVVSVRSLGHKSV
jgi:hypothetical protein